MTELTAASILVFTVGLSLARPTIGRIRVEPPLAAVVGGLLTVAVALVPPTGALRALSTLVEPLLTIASLMAITLVAERAGLFRLAAWWVARASRGDGRLLFRNLFLAGTVTGALFTNDAAVLIYTPMVYQLVEDLAEDSWEKAQKLPFYFAVLYVANLVGPLVISNPINIIVADWLNIGFLQYSRWMLLPAAASIGLSYLGLRIFFRKSIPRSFTLDPELRPTDIRSRFALVTAGVLALTLLGFFTEPVTGISTAYVATAGAVVLLLVYRLAVDGPPMDIIRGVGWDVLVFVMGIFVVATGLREAGLTAALGELMLGASERGAGTAVLITGFTAGVASSVLNNHPVAQIMAMSIEDLSVAENTRHILAYAALVGGDLGPKMLPIGSLAALMWFRMLRDRGVEVSYGLYIKIGIPVTLAAITGALLVLLAQIHLVGAW